jgi:RNA polymerase sigma-70 factor (ECF subfamily)
MEPGRRELERAFRAGEPGALDQAFRLYGSRVMAFARQLCGNQADAEDLTQEAFLAAQAGHTSFRGRSSLPTWLMAIASRRWRDSRRARRAAEIPFADVPRTEPMEAASAAPGPGLDAIRLRQAVARLEPNAAEAFHLVMVQGMTHAEAALVMGRPVGTAKWLVATAVRRLREELQDDAGTEPEGVPADTARGSAGAAAGRVDANQGLGAAGPHGSLRRVFGRVGLH